MLFSRSDGKGWKQLIPDACDGSIQNKQAKFPRGFAVDEVGFHGVGDLESNGAFSFLGF
jgi:hypothetical protein